jgi:predicted permease
MDRAAEEGSMERDWAKELSSRLAPLRLRPEREAEIIEELCQHLEDHVRELIGGGADADTAARQALADLDAPGVLAERLASIERPSPPSLPPPGAPALGGRIAARWLDLRQSIRALRRTPTFTVTVVVTMALTIGPTTALLSIGNWLVWRPVPAVSDASRVGVVYFGRWMEDGQSVQPNRISPLNIADLVAASKTVQALAGTQEGIEAVTIQGRMAENIPAAHADANLFLTLGVRPSAGRFFTPDEDVLPYGAPVAVVSDGLARRAFGSPEGALGKAILLNGQRLEVVGVAPRGFRGITPFSAVDVWYPGAAYRRMHHFSSISPAVTRRDGTFYSFVVRLRHGATFDAVQAEMNVLAQGLLERHPEENSQFRTVRARVFPGLGPDVLARDRYRAMVLRLLLIGAVLVVLGCANVANLLIFRGVRREREYAVRMALGAGRARLLQLQLMESCLLAITGALLGLGLASGMTHLILTLILPAASMSNVSLRVPIDGHVLLAALVLSVAGGLAAGLLPAWMSSGRPVVIGLSQGGMRGTPRGRRLRAGFAAVQLSLSLALLVGALLMVATVRGLHGVDPGFNADGVSVHHIDLASLGYKPARALQYVRELETGLSSVSSVTSASFSYSYPLESAFVQRVQTPQGAPGDAIEVDTNAVTRDYFAVLGISILRGRAFTTVESMAPGEASGNGVIVSRSLARRLFDSIESVGQKVIVQMGKTGREVVVIGVAGDVRTDLVTDAAELTMYEPFAREEVFVMRPSLLVKSGLTTRDATEVVRSVAARVDPRVPISGNQPLRIVIDRRLSGQRVFAWVLSLLGGLGFVLAAVGVYGLLAQAVSERTREFGIRMAMGATRRRVFSLVLRQAALIAGIGGIAGLGLAMLGSRLIQAQLWGVTSRDPWIYAIASLALVAVVFVAAAVPARAATRIEPVEALRTE